MPNFIKLMILESEALHVDAVSGINEQISLGPIKDTEEFNLMMIALRNTIKAQNRVIKQLSRAVDVAS